MDFNSLRKEIISKNSSVKELVNDIFTKIESKDPVINSYICTTKENAIEQAENIDKLIQNGEILPSDLIFDSIETGQSTNTAEVLAAKFQNTTTNEVAL